jgi:hypothetical protein
MLMVRNCDHKVPHSGWMVGKNGAGSNSVYFRSNARRRLSPCGTRTPESMLVDAELHLRLITILYGDS